MSEIAFLGVRELGRLLRSRRLSVVELVTHMLDRLERIGPALGAVVTVLRDQALREAAERDTELAAGRARGPLHGIPYGAKDLLAAAGAPTTWGAEPYRTQRFEGDATVVHRLRNAGAVLCAKLAMVELAGGMGYNQADASFTGPGRTPWDRTRWSGGSSSGSGAAVGGGLVTFAIGSETWGSIQYPAAFCGVTGLRPTYGRVSRHGAMALSWTMDKLGPMARSADDCALVLTAIAGHDPLDPTTLRARFTPPSRLRRRWRIGVLAGTRDRLQPEVLRNFEGSLALLREMGDVEEQVILPDYPYAALAGTIIDAEAASAFEDLVVQGGVAALAAPEDRIGGYAGQVVLAKDYLRAMRARRPASTALQEVLGRFDAVAAPTLPTVAWPLASPFDQVYPAYPGGTDVAPAANVAGVPALFVMNGQGESGLPTSLQLTAAAGHESALLALGMQYQARTGFHRLRPPDL